MKVRYTNKRSQDDQLRRIVGEYYDLGELLTVTKIPKGMVNLSYKIETMKGDKKEVYLFRRYNPETTPSQISFEHALLLELRRRNFLLTPQVIERRNGKSYLKISEGEAHYVAIFSFLSGESKYEWNMSLSSEQEFRNVAKGLALYHQAIDGWKGPYRGQKFITQIPSIVSKWSEYVRRVANSSFDHYFFDQYDYLNDISVKLWRSFDEKPLLRLPEIAIHYDYHAGNLLFQESQVTGILDFNHSGFDYRAFDIAIALMFFCVTWDNTNNGNLSLAKIGAFLTSYQQAWRGEEGIGPLNRHELQSIPQMILASVFFELDWFVNGYYTNQPDFDLYLNYVRHFVRIIRWVEEHWLHFLNLYSLK
jgi:homoserine kinase type II